MLSYNVRTKNVRQIIEVYLFVFIKPFLKQIIEISDLNHIVNNEKNQLFFGMRDDSIFHCRR